MMRRTLTGLKLLPEILIVLDNEFGDLEINGKTPISVPINQKKKTHGIGDGLVLSKEQDSLVERLSEDD
jgi:hypothetical protein